MVILALLAASTLTVVAGAETVARWRWVAAWEGRGYDTALFNTPAATAVRVVVALAAAGVFFTVSGGVWQAGAWGAAAGWLAVVASRADLAQRRIPKEPCWALLGVGTLLGVTDFTAAAAASAAVAAIIIVIIVGLLVAVTRAGFGSGDARLLLALSTGAWWFGFTPTLIGLLLASVIQIVLRFTLLRPWAKRGGGFPFAPALAAGYAAAVVFYSGPSTVCEEWLHLLPCQM